VWHYLLGKPACRHQGQRRGRDQLGAPLSIDADAQCVHILCGWCSRYGALVTGGDGALKDGWISSSDAFEELVGVIEEAVNREWRRTCQCGAILPRKRLSRSGLIRTKINLLPPEIKEVRVVNCGGLQADGGTHVRSTGRWGASG